MWTARVKRASNISYLILKRYNGRSKSGLGIRTVDHGFSGLKLSKSFVNGIIFCSKLYYQVLDIGGGFAKTNLTQQL